MPLQLVIDEGQGIPIPLDELTEDAWAPGPSGWPSLGTHALVAVVIKGRYRGKAVDFLKCPLSPKADAPVSDSMSRMKGHRGHG